MNIQPARPTPSTRTDQTLSARTKPSDGSQGPNDDLQMDSVKFHGKGYDVYADTRPWNPQFSPAKRLQSEGSQVTMSGVRWGYDENNVDPAQWTPRFRDTQIDTSKVKDVYLGMEPSAGTGHSTLIFEFEEPIRSTDGKFQDDRMVVSVEAYRHEGQPYQFWQGKGKNYGLVYQLGSFQDRTQHTARKLGRAQELRKLDLEPEQKSALLQHALDESVKDRTGDYYHTTRDSCYTGAQNLIEGALGQDLKRWAIPGGVLLKPTMVVPTLSSLAFDDRGLLADAPAQIYQPDPILYPAKQGKPSALDPLVSKLSGKHPTVWKRAFQAAGMGTGLALASQLGMGWVGTVATAAMTTAASGVLADHLRLSAGQEYIDPTPFYPRGG